MSSKTSVLRVDVFNVLAAPSHFSSKRIVFLVDAEVLDSLDVHIPMRVLVTGGAGFIGHHLCRRLLSEGHQVTVLDDFSTGLESNLDGLAVEIVRHDVREQFDVVCDQIYHLACPASPAFYQRDGIGTLRTAVQGTLNALELASRRKARILVASTSEVYGDPQVSPQPETYFGNVNTWGPRACYDEGKRAAEALCYEFQSQARADVRVARIFNTYGPGMRLDDGRVMTEFITAALDGRPLRLDADGEQTRTFCYIDDLIEGLLLLMAHSDVSSPVNLGGAQEVTIRELSLLIGETAVAPVQLSLAPRRSDDPMRREPELLRASALLKWRPAVDLRDGLELTLRSIRLAREKLQLVVLVTLTNRIHLHKSRTIPSLTRQSKGWDLLVVVDDSTESTDEIRTLFESSGLPQMVYVRNRRSRGAAGSWNTGLSAIGERMPDAWVAILDDDDEWSGEHLSSCYEMSKKETDAVISGIVTYVDESPASIPHLGPFERSAFLYHNPGWQGSNTFVKLSQVVRAGLFDESLACTHDRDLALRLLALDGFRHTRTGLVTVKYHVSVNEPAYTRRLNPQKLEGLRGFWKKYQASMDEPTKSRFLDHALKMFGFRPAQIII